jgi:cysteine-rich repeat protein
MTKRIIGALALLALFGCSGETGIRLLVRTDIDVPADLDTVRVTVFAGATGTELFERSQSFGSLTPADFPVTVGVTSGSSYGDWVMFRVEGLVGSDLVVERWVVSQFVDGEIREVLVELQAACLLTPCDGGQECRGGACETAERPAGWTIDCGDGVPDSGEECDSGDGNSDTAADACRTTCVAAGCGDTVVDTGEQCDDGNTTSGDGCSSACRTEGATCGDGEVNGTEECDDGNATADDGCEADCTFSCHAAADCDDDDQCTTDSCDTVAGGRLCNHVIDDGADCDDGNDCTTGETCDAAGACTGGTNECECDPTGTDTCEADHGDDEPCNGTLVCDDATSACVVDTDTVLDPGDPCDNGVFCDGVDTCGGSPIACESPGDPCAACQACDETGDECDIDAGSCFIADTCYADAAANPANACEVCDADTLATGWSDATDGTTCDDGDICTTGETCTAGVCGGGTGTCACDPAADACETDFGDDDPCNGTLYCETATRTCVVEPGTPLVVDAACDDGLECNGDDTCQTGVSGLECTPDAVSPCRTCETCAETSPGHTCTLDSGFCILGTPAGCVARGGTNPTNGCEVCDDTVTTTDWTPNTGAACDDTDFCNGPDTCGADSLCSVHGVAPCGATCHSGCVEATETCTVAAGSCYIGAACYADGAPNPTNDCQVCSAATSQTAWTNRVNGAPCAADADGCTIDACNAGSCAHTAECVDSTVAVAAGSTAWRFCITDAACATGAGAACTTVNVPGSWNTFSTSGSPMTHCAAGGGFWVAQVTGLTSGTQCYRFYANGATWISDPAAGADCGTGSAYCDPPGTDTNCRVIVP